MTTDTATTISKSHEEISHSSRRGKLLFAQDSATKKSCRRASLALSTHVEHILWNLELLALGGQDVELEQKSSGHVPLDI